MSAPAFLEAIKARGNAPPSAGVAQVAFKAAKPVSDSSPKTTPVTKNSRSSKIISQKPIYRNVPEESRQEKTMPQASAQQAALMEAIRNKEKKKVAEEASSTPTKRPPASSPVKVHGNETPATAAPPTAQREPITTTTTKKGEAVGTARTSGAESLKLHKRGRFQILVDKERIAVAFKSQLSCQVV